MYLLDDTNDIVIIPVVVDDFLFTGHEGKLVSLDDALDGCERILRDEFKDVPESALYMIGAIAEAKQPAKSKTEGEAAAEMHES